MLAWPPSETTEASAKRVEDLCVLLKGTSQKDTQGFSPLLSIPLVTGNHVSGWEGAGK